MDKICHQNRNRKSFSNIIEWVENTREWRAQVFTQNSRKWEWEREREKERERERERGNEKGEK